MSLLKLADGREINLSTKEVVEDAPTVPVLEEQGASFTPAPKADMRLEDLPADPRTMTVVCAVLSFRFMGLPDRDIAEALGCSAEQLYEVVNGAAYLSAYEMVLTSFVQGQQNAAKDIISASAVEAARQMKNIMSSSKSESNRLRASEGILNRAGISDTGHGDPMGGGLIIKLVKDTKTDIQIKVG